MKKIVRNKIRTMLIWSILPLWLMSFFFGRASVAVVEVAQSQALTSNKAGARQAAERRAAMDLNVDNLVRPKYKAPKADPFASHVPQSRALPAAQVALQRAIAAAQPLPLPMATLTRAALEVGTANQLALKAFDVVLTTPGQRYNPLLLHGASGVGKTHIVHALGNALRAAWPTKSVACLSAATFAEDFVGALQDGSVERWRARFRAADVLILDDVQHLGDKERTQEELFHLFNQLFDRGGQIVLTADCPPRELHGFADRLRSRFEGGLVVALQSPDRALRERLVHRWLLEAGQEPSHALVTFLADRDVARTKRPRSMQKIIDLCVTEDVAATQSTGVKYANCKGLNTGHFQDEVDDNDNYNA